MECNPLEPTWELIINAIKIKVSSASTFICFGSRVIGTHSEKSDYDLIAIAARNYTIKEQLQLEKLLIRDLELKIHLTLISFQTLKAGMRMSPYIQMALKSGIIVGEIGESQPLSKLGILNEIDNIRLEIKDEEASKVGLLRALRSANYLSYLLTGKPDLKELHNTLKLSKKYSATKIRSSLQLLFNHLELIAEQIPKNKSDRELEERLHG